MKLSDIYYTLFRHKKKIIFFSLLGVAAAVFLYFTHKPLYTSTAKLVIRYIVDERSINPLGTDNEIKTPDSRGSNIINTEIQLLTSWDNALKVADQMRDQNLVSKDVDSDKDDRYAAAVMILSNLEVTVPRNSNIIQIAFSHSDPNLAQNILSQLIKVYLTQHQRVHREDRSSDALLSQETDLLRSSLKQTEEELTALYAKIGVTSLEETKITLTDEKSAVRTSLFNAEAELAAYQTLLGQPEEDDHSQTNRTDVVEVSALEPAVTSEYQNLTARLSQFRAKENELMLQFTPSNPLVAAVQQQIAATSSRKKQLEADHPQLKLLGKLEAKVGQAGPVQALVDARQVEQLKARVKALKAQLAQIEQDQAELNSLESSLKELERKQELIESNYKYLSHSLQKARIDSKLNTNVTNISTAQEPSPARQDMLPLYKKMGIALAVGIFGSFALAFLIEMYLDQTVKRPKDLENPFGVPVYLSIPYMKKISNFKAAPVPQIVEDTNGAKSAKPAKRFKRERVEPWDVRHPLREYYEALRDQVVLYFENMPHKPKLLGVTGCMDGAGASTVASALAASLSETGDGKVLMVDMKQRNGSVHPFFRGKPDAGCRLNDVFDNDKKQLASVHENLALVSASPAPNQRRTDPRKLTELMPKLKATDYDYIIFDMPPVTQTSITPRVAASLDQIIMVVESEKVHRETFSQAHRLLKRSNANVAAVMNKQKSYMPRQLNGTE